MIEEARSMASKQFTLFSAEETQQFDNPTSCLRHVLDKGGKCGPHCTLVVSSPVGVNVRDNLQQTTIPSLGKASLSLDGNLFAIDPVVTKQKSTTSLGYKSKASTSKLIVLHSADTTQNGLEQHLYHAIAIGNPEALLAVLESPDKPSNLNISSLYPAEEGGAAISPLGLAALAGNVSCLEILLNAGADIDWQDEQTGYTALHWATLGAVKASIKCLVKKNADLNKKDKQGFVPLHYGVLQGAEVVSSLVQQNGEGAGLIQHTPTGVSPIMLAALLGSTDCLKLLLHHVQSNSLTHHVDAQGLSVLHYSTWGKVPKAVKVLLSHQAGPELIRLSDQWGRNCLHYAAAAGAMDVIRLLLKKGAAVTEKDKSLMSCLHWAVMSSNVSCVKFLMESRETHNLIGSCDAAGLTIMHYAVVGGNPDMMDLLISKDIDVGVCDSSCYSVLLWATAFLLVDRAKELVERGVAVHNDQSESYNVQTSQSDWAAGLQPLHAAARVGLRELCELFLNAGAILHCCSNYGYTALHHASYYGHIDVVELLLNKGAQIDILTESDETSLHLAASQGHAQTVQLLLDRGADKLLSSGEEQNSPAHLAAAAGHADTLAVLLRNGTPADLLRTSDGRSLLHLAALNGHISCLRILLQEGASPVIKDDTKERFTALDLAMIHDHASCMDLLVQHHAPSGGGKFHKAVVCIQTTWRLYKKKRREAAAQFWAGHVILRCCKLWIMRTRATRLRKIREKARHRAATLIQRHWREYSAAKRRYESTYMKLKTRLQQEQLAVQLIMRELLEQEKSIRLPPATSKTSGPSISALQLLKTSQPLHPSVLDQSVQSKKQTPSSQSCSRVNSRKMNSSLKKKREPDVFKVHSKKKLDGYIHHVVSNSLPPTAQVGGAVIKSTKLPLPPIQIPNTAPPMIITAASKKTLPQTHVDPVSTGKNEVSSHLQGNTSREPTDAGNNEVDDRLLGQTYQQPIDTELEALQNDSNQSVNEVSEMDSHNNNDNDATGTIVSLSTENLESPLPLIKATETASISTPEVDSYRRKVKPLKSPVTTKSPKHSLKHKKKVLPSTLSSAPLLDSANKGDHSCDRLTAESKDDKVLPTLRGKNVKPSSQFDVVTSLTGEKRRSEHDVKLDTHVTQLHNCAERHQKLRQVLELLEHAHQQRIAISAPEGDGDKMNVAELRQHLNTALNEAVRLRVDTESLKTNHKKLQQVTQV